MGFEFVTATRIVPSSAHRRSHLCRNQGRSDPKCSVASPWHSVKVSLRSPTCCCS
jgi:hypothetical protein